NRLVIVRKVLAVENIKYMLERKVSKIVDSLRIINASASYRFNKYYLRLELKVLITSLLLYSLINHSLYLSKALCRKRCTPYITLLRVSEYLRLIHLYFDY